MVGIGKNSPMVVTIARSMSSKMDFMFRMKIQINDLASWGSQVYLPLKEGEVPVIDDG